MVGGIFIMNKIKKISKIALAILLLSGVSANAFWKETLALAVMVTLVIKWIKLYIIVLKNILI